jgi:hypothetical protein
MKGIEHSITKMYWLDSIESYWYIKQLLLLSKTIVIIMFVNILLYKITPFTAIIACKYDITVILPLPFLPSFSYY